MSRLTAALPVTMSTSFSPEAVARLVGQRPVLRVEGDHREHRATVVAAGLADGRLTVTLEVPDGVAGTLPWPWETSAG
jgi:hypothetical protein